MEEIRNNWMILLQHPVVHQAKPPPVLKNSQSGKQSGGCGMSDAQVTVVVND
jgi:hypothetical protein